VAHSPKKRLELRAAYIGGLPLEAAADKVGVPYATARNWYRAARDKGDNWDRFQASCLMVAGGGLDQAMGRTLAAGLMRCEALAERLREIVDPVEGVKAAASLGDTLAKLRAASKGMMPEADQLAIETGTIKAFADLFMQRHPALAEAMLSTVEAWANGQR
jgi:hypothetical protein